MIDSSALSDKITKLATKRGWYYYGYEKNISFYIGVNSYVRLPYTNLKHIYELTPVQILKFIKERIYEEISRTRGSGIKIYLSDINDLCKNPNALLTEPYIVL